MKILALETSCDETACAIVEDGWKVHANVIASSLDLHKETGGVVPEVAARAHVEAIMPVIEKAMAVVNGHPVETRRSASLPSVANAIDAIAVTTEPGLQTSLLVGIETAKWLAYLWKKPLIKVNHIRGHVYANWLERSPEEDPIEFPVVCLSVSGGHNEIILMRSHEDWEVIGRTQDDAAGEAFDKVARILGLSYPGGPEIERHARNHKHGVETRCGASLQEPLRFPRAWLNQNQSNKWDGTSFNFSFSGLKSEALRVVQKASEGENGLPRSEVGKISWAFQDAVCDVLVTKLVGAAEKYEAKEVHLAGGVSANRYLREMLQERIGETIFRWPEKMEYCTDNAAMISSAAYFQPR